MKFSEYEENKIKSLPLVFRLAVDMLVGVIKKIFNNECDEEGVTGRMVKLNANDGSR